MSLLHIYPNGTYYWILMAHKQCATSSFYSSLFWWVVAVQLSLLISQTLWGKEAYCKHVSQLCQRNTLYLCYNLLLYLRASMASESWTLQFTTSKNYSASDSCLCSSACGQPPWFGDWHNWDRRCLTSWYWRSLWDCGVAAVRGHAVEQLDKSCSSTIVLCY
jgi:hypothetical protein